MPGMTEDQRRELVAALEEVSDQMLAEVLRPDETRVYSTDGATKDGRKPYTTEKADR